MNYKVITIKEGDDHEAVKRFEDEEMLIVDREDGVWYNADEFFHVVGEVSFTIN